MSATTAVAHEKPATSGKSPIAPEPAHLEYIRVALIVPSKTNPRQKRTPEKDAELLDSVKRDGVTQSLLLRSRNATLNDVIDLETRYKKLKLGFDKFAVFAAGDPIYEIVAGERRWEAAVKAELAEVPAVIRKLTNEKAEYLQIVENLQREDLNAIDEGRAFRKLLAQGKSAQEIADTLGVGKTKSVRYIYQRAQLCDLLPGIQDAIETGRLTAGHGDLLVRLDHEGQKAGLRWIEKVEREKEVAPSVRVLDEWIKGRATQIERQKEPKKGGDAPAAAKASIPAPAATPAAGQVPKPAVDQGKSPTAPSSKPAQARVPVPQRQRAAALAPRIKPVEPVKLNDRCQKQLRMAINYRGNGEKTWLKLIASGATDAQIKKTLSQVMGEDGGIHSNDIGDVCYRGKNDPRVWLNTVVVMKKSPSLHGAVLIATVRDLLKIPTPEQAKQAAAERAFALNVEIDETTQAAVFDEFQRKFKLEPWALRSMVADFLCESLEGTGDVAQWMSRWVQKVLRWPKPKSDGYTYHEAMKHADRTQKYDRHKFSIGLLGALIVHNYMRPADLLRFTKHLKINGKAIQRRVQAQLKAARSAKR